MGCFEILSTPPSLKIIEPNSKGGEKNEKG
jgi:hypothetical protein